MPTNLFAADVSFPSLDETKSDRENLLQVTNYLYMMLENLRYTLGNLGEGNFNGAELDSIAKTINEPVFARIQNEEDRLTELSVTADGLNGRVSTAEGTISELSLSAGILSNRITSAEGNISTLQQTASALSSQLSNAEGNISTLQQTATSLSSRMNSAEGSVSSLQQTVNSFSLSVSNGEDSSTISLNRNGVAVSSKTISFSGMVLFSDLSRSNSYTIINGGNIRTGKISAIDFEGCNYKTLLGSGQAISDGEIMMCYLGYGNVAGGIKLDTGGSGSPNEANWRMFIYTSKVYSVPFALKLKSSGGMSLESDQLIYMEAATTLRIVAPSIHLAGNVYINNVLQS